MKISYAICVKDEIIEIQNLLSLLLKNKKQDDEIVILFDKNNGSEEVEEFLRSHSINDEFRWYPGEFNGNFGEWKNKLNSLCNGNYIINLDADEILNDYFFISIPLILEYNKEIDGFWVSRINTLIGDKDKIEKYITSQGWVLDQFNRLNFPDKQFRIFRNSPNIKWVGKVHERIVGYKTYAELPNDDVFCILHKKTLERQIKQNQMYERL
jgi:hypothetical protein